MNTKSPCTHMGVTITTRVGSMTGLCSGCAQVIDMQAWPTPAADAKQMTLPQGVTHVDERRLREILSGYAEFADPTMHEIASLAYEVRNWRAAADAKQWERKCVECEQPYGDHRLATACERTRPAPTASGANTGDAPVGLSTAAGEVRQPASELPFKLPVRHLPSRETCRRIIKAADGAPIGDCHADYADAIVRALNSLPTARTKRR